MSADTTGEANSIDPKMFGTSVLSLSSEQAPELCGPATVSVDALFKHRHLRGFTAEVPLGLNKRRHLRRLFNTDTHKMSTDFVLCKQSVYTLTQGHYLSFLDDVCKLSAPHETTFRRYEKEAVATVERAG